MHFLTYLAFSVAAVSAAPATADVGVSSASLDKFIRRALAEYQAVDGQVYQAHRPPPLEYTPDESAPISSSNKGGVEKRCANNRAIVIDRIDRFLDWDMQLSPILRGPGEIEVQAGLSISNSVEVTAGLSAERAFIIGDLGAQVGVSYTKTWTSDSRIHEKFTVLAGMHGAVVINPTTVRHYGRVLVGCPGSQRQLAAFQAENYIEKNINGVGFIDGEISLCQKPVGSALTRCEGSGAFIPIPN